MKINNTLKTNFTDYEINSLTYKDALKLDHRSYCQYYLSLLKTKHILIFSFYTKNDYNSQMIKKIIFIFSFALLYTVNCLFFQDWAINRIYEENSDFDLFYQLPQIIYSSIISTVLNTLLKFLALSEGDILKLKRKKVKKNLEQKESDLNKKLNFKFILFFIISTIFLLFFWYYLSMFCAIYVNTQIHLIKDTLISFALSMLYPFGIYLLPGLFRIPALANRKKKRMYLYSISKVLQFI